MQKQTWNGVLMALICVALGISAAYGRDNVRAVTYSAHADFPSCHMNMGPMGAKAWMRGYQFVVMSIDAESPADGSLELGDVVVAAGGTTFDAAHDPRMTLGWAIGEAEATGRPLRLKVLRGGRRRGVKVELPELGALGPTWPSTCAKSTRILDAACRTLLNAQLPNGRIVTDGDMGTFLGGLLMLASGNPNYLDGARRAAYYAASLEYGPMPTNNWPMGYGGLLMAEYYLATGDDTVLVKLAENAALIAAGQMKCGTWGHNSPAGGYGALNQPGIIAAIALVLTKECGVPVDEVVLNKALDFFGRYAELGSVPYGDHGPGRWPDDNGRNATAALLMKLAGRDVEAAAFSQSVAMSYWMREEGHTGGFFSMTWGPLGAALAGDDSFRTFMDYQDWYYNLIRTWKGELTMLPYQEALTRFDSSSYIQFGGVFTTGGIGLAYALPMQRLRIMGAPRSVFSPGSLTGPLAAARKLYLAREWQACDAALAAIEADNLKSDEAKRGFAQLKDARALARTSTDSVLTEIDSNLMEEASYRASEQFAALKRCLGNAGDVRFEAFNSRLAEGTLPWWHTHNKRLYDDWARLSGAAVMTWIPNGVRAHQFVEGLPSLRLPIWEPLSPTIRVVPQAWRTLLLEKDAELPRGWEKGSYDDGAWREGEGIFTFHEEPDEAVRKTLSQGRLAARRIFNVADPVGAALRVRLQTVRNALTRVYLNGELIIDVERGQRGGYATIPLDESVFTLLKRGENVLAVTSTHQGAKGNRLDVGLEINRVAVQQRMLPVRRVERLDHEALPEGEQPLRVRETRDRYLKALVESCKEKSTPELLVDLGAAVPFTRHLAEDALVARGLEGIRAIAGLADHADWRVRSAYCNSIIKAAAACRPKKDGEDSADAKASAFIKTQVPVLSGLLSDEHFWVRTRAATALPLLGPEAAVAVPQLLKQVLDPDTWVRNAVIRAIGTLSENPEEAVAAALKIMQSPRASYGPPAAALNILKKYPKAGSDRLAALLVFLRDPPEGFGKRVLGSVMDMAAELDPDGRQLIPVLIDAASDTIRYSGQRGNPRGKAIEMLGDYGPKAAAALPALEAILESETKLDTAQHEAAKAATVQIRGESTEMPMDAPEDK